MQGHTCVEPEKASWEMSVQIQHITAAENEVIQLACYTVIVQPEFEGTLD